MKSLNEVKWNKEPNQLLVHDAELENKFPTILFLRHSAREEPEDIKEALEANLTLEGKKAAELFGQGLNKKKT